MAPNHELTQAIEKNISSIGGHTVQSHKRNFCVYSTRLCAARLLGKNATAASVYSEERVQRSRYSSLARTVLTATDSA